MSITESNLPTHVAIIPDGNRRWAKGKNLKPWQGHEAGAENTEKLTRQALKMGIKYLSFWGSSMENLSKRPFQEKRALLWIYEKYFKKLIKSRDIHDNKVKINIIGLWQKQFPPSLKKVVRDCLRATDNYNDYFLNFFMAYSGDQEMILAVKNVVKNYHFPRQINARVIKENLMTRDLPPVDFLIRTGGEPHLSAGFMMWDLANSQLYFPETLYPAFDEKEFKKAVKVFEERERRLGK